MLAAVAWVAWVQASVFAPPLDQPLRVVTERVQHEGGAPIRYRTERLVRFRRDGIGYVGEVRVLAATAEAPGNMAAMFQAGYSGLIGQTLLFRMDGAGKAVALENRAAVWDAFCRGIGAMAMQHRGSARAQRATTAEAITAPLRALPPERQLSLLASLAEAIVAEEADQPPGVRKVRVPGASPLGGEAMLDGTATITLADGRLRNVTHAEADVAEGHVGLDRDQAIDTRTGLLISSTETIRTRLGAQAIEHVTTVTVTPAPASDWAE